MKNLRKNKKFVLGVSVVLTLIMIMAATFAWFTQKDEVVNEFSTGGIPKGTVNVWEDFKEPVDWKPGQTVKKDVGVINGGQMPVVVRASFMETLQKMKASGDELSVSKYSSINRDINLKAIPAFAYAADTTWKKPGADYTITGLPTDASLYMKTETVDGKERVSFGMISSQRGVVSGDVSLEAGTHTITVSNAMFEYFEYNQKVDSDWLAGGTQTFTDKSHVDGLIALNYHTANMTSNPTAVNEKDKWYYNAEDGWFYYIGVVEGGTITPLFLESVALAGAADNRYQYMNYKLRITVNGLQATKAAIKDSWGLAEANPVYQALAAQLPE